MKKIISIFAEVFKLFEVNFFFIFQVLMNPDIWHDNLIIIKLGSQIGLQLMAMKTHNLSERE